MCERESAGCVYVCVCEGGVCVVCVCECVGGVGGEYGLVL